MMKLTVTLLAALAAADAAEARNHRQARRQYGYGYSAKPYHETSAAPVESTPYMSVATPAPTSVKSFPAIPYKSESSKPPSENVSTMGYPSASSEAPKASSKPGNEYPTGGYGQPKSSDKPVKDTSSYPAKPTGGYSAPAKSSSPVKASSAVGPSSLAYPTGGSKPSSKPVEASSKPYGSGIFPSSGAVYPTGTGYKSSTPVSDMVTKTIYSSGKPVGTSVCQESKITSSVPVSEITKTLTQTLVYTVGTGSSARPMTTEVTSVSTQTIYSTVIVTVTLPGSKPTQPVYPAGGQDEGTTTIKSTSTTTKFVTVHASKPASAAGVVSGNSYPTGPAGPGPAGPSYPAVPAGSQCPAPVTVTVTAKETVTVTKSSNKPSDKPSNKPESGYPAQPTKSSSGAESYKPGNNKPSATPSWFYPAGNMTYPAGGPTGFRTSGKPYGTGMPSKPTSIPSFSYVSQGYSAEAPSKSASPAKSSPAGYGAVPMSSAPAPAKSSPAGYGSEAKSSPAPAKSSPAGYGAVPMSSAPAPAKTSAAGYGYY